MSRNVTFVYALAAMLAVGAGVCQNAQADERDDEIKALRATVNQLQKALLAEQAARAQSAERTNKSVRELTRKLDQGEVVIRHKFEKLFLILHL